VIGGIGRTNDAILYGGRVTLWVDCDQEAVEAVLERVPSGASKDYGRPFAEIFKDYEYDFYKVDPHLFSPAVVTIANRRSGIARRCGSINRDVLRQSFYA
jgi:methenyltetrahydromethanopterin cyclohydrolase